jgi:hypothetical protein
LNCPNDIDDFDDNENEEDGDDEKQEDNDDDNVDDDLSPMPVESEETDYTC